MTAGDVVLRKKRNGPGRGDGPQGGPPRRRGEGRSFMKANLREGYIAGPGGRLWYGVCGEGGVGTPLLVVHGGPGFLSMTETYADLAGERRVYFYDQLGGGRSDRAADPSRYCVDGFVAELAAVREALSLKEVFLLGFSWGAALVCSYLLAHRPPGVKGLILSGPLLSTPLWERDQRRLVGRLPASLKEVIRTAEETGDFGEAYEGAMMSFYRRHLCLLDPWPPALEEAFGRLSLEVYNALWGPSEFTCTGTLKNLDLTDRLHLIGEPVLLTCGDRDEADPRTVKEFQLAFPNADMAVLPRASHFHHLEQPGIYKALLRGFMNAIEEGSVKED